MAMCGRSSGKCAAAGAHYTMGLRSEGLFWAVWDAVCCVWVRSNVLAGDRKYLVATALTHDLKLIESI